MNLMSSVCMYTTKELSMQVDIPGLYEAHFTSINNLVSFFHGIFLT